MQSALTQPGHDTRVSPLQNSLQNSLTGNIVLAVSATALVAACAHVSLPLPFTPVPLTLQNFAVILVGMFLGPVAGFAAMALYLIEGAAGLPVFTPHSIGGIAHLMGPNAGYLFSYPLAAAIAGWGVRATRNLMPRFAGALVAGILATLPIFILGAGWLAHMLHLSAPATFTLAIAPFLPGEVVKLIAAAGIFSAAHRWQRA